MMRYPSVTALAEMLDERAATRVMDGQAG
jgi:hypothetical protein